MNQDKMEKIVALAKRRGFIFPGSEIYGGFTGTWDYGPLGVLLKKNLKDLWWKENVQKRSDVVGIDAAIIMNPKAWEASGHLEAFTDPLVECKTCHKRFRADKTEEISKHGQKEHPGEKTKWTDPKNFNLLVKAYFGIVEESEQEVYLRGEITNGANVNFKNVLDSTRVKIPFGIAQIGKAFRNEITPGNFTFRSREFEQMELQFYVRPNDEEANKWFEYWKEQRMKFYLNLGINKENLRFRDHQDNERAHYAKKATDIEYNAPFGWSEFLGIHNRGDFDLSRHEKYSGMNMKYKDQTTGEEFTPWDIETSEGVDRATLFLLLDAYTEEENRTVLKLSPSLAPYKLAVFPLVANKEDISKKARSIYEDLKSEFMTAWDDRGNIGKRYLSQDEAGTPFCVTVDYQTLEDETVTIRDRDSAKQERIKVSEISAYVKKKLES